MRRLLLLLLLLLLLAPACSDEDADDVVVGGATTTFDGATTPTSIASSASAVALLTDVTVEAGVVTFAFRSEVPGVDVQYVEPPILEDASGEEITVAGDAFLHVRMEPASGVDLSGEELVQTYTGPTRVAGSGVVAEVARTGDFEAVLGWVIGLDAQRAYRVEADASTVRVYFST